MELQKNGLYVILYLIEIYINKEIYITICRLLDVEKNLIFNKFLRYWK